MIFETIITTTNLNNKPHVAPMGVQIEEGTIIIKPFKPSATLNNILSNRKAVLNVTSDVKVFAGSVTGRKNFELIELKSKVGFRLKNLHSYAVLNCISVFDDSSRPTLRLKKIEEVFNTNFPGINRAQGAVIEGAILVSRLHMLPIEKVLSEIKYLEIAVFKTAGPNELESWSWIKEAISEAYKK